MINDSADKFFKDTINTIVDFGNIVSGGYDLNINNPVEIRKENDTNDKIGNYVSSILDSSLEKIESTERKIKSIGKLSRRIKKLAIGNIIKQKLFENGKSANPIVSDEDIEVIKSEFNGDSKLLRNDPSLSLTGDGTIQYSPTTTKKLKQLKLEALKIIDEIVSTYPKRIESLRKRIQVMQSSLSNEVIRRQISKNLVAQVRVIGRDADDLFKEVEDSITMLEGKLIQFSDIAEKGNTQLKRVISNYRDALVKLETTKLKVERKLYGPGRFGSDIDESEKVRLSSMIDRLSTAIDGASTMINILENLSSHRIVNVDTILNSIDRIKEL